VQAAARNDKITKLELTDDVGCHQRRSIKQESSEQGARAPNSRQVALKTPRRYIVDSVAVTMRTQSVR